MYLSKFLHVVINANTSLKDYCHLYSLLLSPLIFHKLFLSSFLSINCITIYGQVSELFINQRFPLIFCRNISIIIGCESTLGMEMQLAWQNDESFSPLNGVYAFAWQPNLLFFLFLYKKREREIFLRISFKFFWGFF